MSRRPDVAFVVEPALLDAVSCLFLAKCFGVASWLHVQDFEVDIAFALGQIPDGWVGKLARRFESWIMRQFDVVSTISQPMQNKVLQKGVDPAKAVLFPNWANTEAIFPLDRESPLRGELGISSEAVVALFSGTVGTKQGVDLLIETAMLLNEPGLEFLICGNGPAAESLKEKTRGLPNVRVLPLQPLDRLNELLNVADIHLLPQKTEVADLVMPSKLINMMASGRPIVSSAKSGTEIERVVSQCGLVVEPENAEAMAGAILKLAQNRSERLRLGAAARRFAVDNLRHDRILAGFEQTLAQVAGAKVLTDPVPTSGSPQ